MCTGAAAGTKILYKLFAGLTTRSDMEYLRFCRFFVDEDHGSCMIINRKTSTQNIQRNNSTPFQTRSKRCATILMTVGSSGPIGLKFFQKSAPRSGPVTPLPFLTCRPMTVDIQKKYEKNLIPSTVSPIFSHTSPEQAAKLFLLYHT